MKVREEVVDLLADGAASGMLEIGRELSVVPLEVFSAYLTLAQRAVAYAAAKGEDLESLREAVLKIWQAIPADEVTIH